LQNYSYGPGTVVKAQLPYTGVSRTFTLGADYVWRCGVWGFGYEDFTSMATITEVVANG